jgi:hypothetical protein
MDCAGLEPAGHGVPEEAEALRPSIAMLPPQPRAGSVVSPALGSESAEGASAKSRSEMVGVAAGVFDLRIPRLGRQ